MSAEWLIVAFLAAFGWLWWDGMKKRELAISAARGFCRQAGVQLLDDTVSQKVLRLGRDDDRRVRLYREFGFEYTDTGDNRLPGRVYVLGEQVLEVNLLITRGN